MRAEDNAAAAIVRRSARALAGIAGALLSVRLLAAAGHLTSGARVVRPLPRVGFLRHHGLVHHGRIRLDAEDAVVQVDVPQLGAAQVHYFRFRHRQSLENLRRLLANHDHAALRTRHGAAQRNDVALWIDRQNAQVLDGHPRIAEVAGHAHVLEGAARGGARADRARVAPAIGLTVRFRAAVEVVALHHTREAFALGGADHVDDLALGKDAGVDARAEHQVFEAVRGNLPQRLESVPVGQASLLELALLWLRRAWPGTETELHRGVAVGFGCSKLGDEARPRFDQRRCRDNTVFVE